MVYFFVLIITLLTQKCQPVICQLFMRSIKNIVALFDFIFNKIMLEASFSNKAGQNFSVETNFDEELDSHQMTDLSVLVQLSNTFFQYLK